MPPKLVHRKPSGRLPGTWRGDGAGSAPVSIWELMERWQEGEPGQRVAALLAPGHILGLNEMCPQPAATHGVVDGDAELLERFESLR
eukprot:2540430-Amphidinium_carterae.1